MSIRYRLTENQYSFIIKKCINEQYENPDNPKSFVLHYIDKLNAHFLILTSANKAHQIPALLGSVRGLGELIAEDLENLNPAEDTRTNIFRQLNGILTELKYGEISISSYQQSLKQIKSLVINGLTEKQ